MYLNVIQVTMFRFIYKFQNFLQANYQIYWCYTVYIQEDEEGGKANESIPNNAHTNKSLTKFHSCHKNIYTLQQTQAPILF